MYITQKHKPVKLRNKPRGNNTHKRTDQALKDKDCWIKLSKEVALYKYLIGYSSEKHYRLKHCKRNEDGFPTYA